MTRANRHVPAIKVHQWLPGWDRIDFDVDEHRSKPAEFFYLLALPARELRSLSGISRREAKNAAPRTEDLGIQRQHDPERSDEISRFVEFGYPWSTLSEPKRASAEFNDLRKPGWLPTAVVLNILPKGAQRNGAKLDDKDVAKVAEAENGCMLELPYAEWSDKWSPTAVPPFEVIDGQHRLWAFEQAAHLSNFELPVVAFVGLDISWQAYLFWTINIKPKRINSSLAFDLYPLLRSEDWLDRAEGHSIYRETRAQELTEILWSYPASPWYDRINMLGERQNPWVSQSAWIKSLMATFVRSWDRRTSATGGLFGGRSRQSGEVLGWSRAQQAAFLIRVWQAIEKSVASSDLDWAKDLRRRPSVKKERDLAFFGPYSLINTDQGVRGVLQVVNDLFYLNASALKLNEWRPDEQAAPDLVHGVERALESLERQSFVGFIDQTAQALVEFDWRTSSTPELDDDTRRAKLVFRGSSGYKELRSLLLRHVATREDEVGDVARRVSAIPA